jgi:hypothetical protein
MSEVTKMVLYRLRNGFVAGFLSILIASPTFTLLGQGEIDLPLLQKLFFASLAGGISGLILAAYKYAKETWGLQI